MKSSQNIAGGIILILLGVLLLLAEFDIKIPITFKDFWPLIFLIPGFIIILTSFKNGSSNLDFSSLNLGIFLFLFGILGILTSQHVLDMKFLKVIKLWPIFLVHFGLNIIFKNSKNQWLIIFLSVILFIIGIATLEHQADETRLEKIESV